MLAHMHVVQPHHFLLLVLKVHRVRKRIVHVLRTRKQLALVLAWRNMSKHATQRKLEISAFTWQQHCKLGHQACQAW